MADHFICPHPPYTHIHWHGQSHRITIHRYIILNSWTDQPIGGITSIALITKRFNILNGMTTNFRSHWHDHQCCSLYLSNCFLFNLKLCIPKHLCMLFEVLCIHVWRQQQNDSHRWMRWCSIANLHVSEREARFRNLNVWRRFLFQNTSEDNGGNGEEKHRPGDGQDNSRSF